MNSGVETGQVTRSVFWPCRQFPENLLFGQEKFSINNFQF